MKPPTKRILLSLLVVSFIGFSFVAWGTVLVVSWARELPNRIQFDTSGMGDVFGKVIVSSYHEVLNRGDIATQQHVLRGFLELCEKEPGGCEWIRTEFSGEIANLTASPDTEIASAASELLERINDGAPALQ